VLLDELESSWQRASLIRHQLIIVFFKLAVVVGRQFSHDSNDADDLVGQACLTMIRAVERFDAARGYRFSSYATRAIRSELTRYVTRQRRHGWVTLELTDLASICDSGTRHPELVRHVTTFHALEDLLQRLENREEHVVRSRFGLQNRPGCFTLQRLADEYGVTRERIRQLECRALKKLREMATESDSWTVLHWYAD
jgi:RNA polymerase sigma factor (sigma-70 family)